MNDGRDAEDARLLDSGEHARLLATYEPVIVGRCVAALRGSLDAEDVAQDVKLRLWRELSHGKRYPVPFRVVVHKVIGWTVQDCASSSPSGSVASASQSSGRATVVSRPAKQASVAGLLAGLPERQRQCWTLRLAGLEPEQIAAELGMTRNAVDQALHNGRKNCERRWTVPEELMALFEEYAARFARGERPDLREYLSRAGGEADELARLVDGFLLRAEPPEPDDETVALTAAWLAGEPPLVELRTRRGLKRGEVVDALIERLGLDRAKREKVRRYYHEVETGQRVPTDERLVSALAEILRARAADLLAWRPRPLVAEPAYFRTEALAAAPPLRPAEEPDEIDRLFAARG